MTLPPRSTLAVYVDALWFPLCIGMAVVPYAVNATVVAGMLLVGLTLLTYEKDRRYPTLTWGVACRTFFETHAWSRLFVWGTLLLVFWVNSGVDDRDPRGLCLIAATIYAMLKLAAPRRDPVTVPIDSHDTDSSGNA